MKKIGSAAVSALTSIAAAVVVAGCGGGGGDGGANGSGGAAEGAWEGTLTNSNSSEFEMLVLEDGTYWVLYGDRINDILLVNGFVQGVGTATATEFTSNSARDFGRDPPLRGSVTATYTAGGSFQGTFASNAGSVAFSGAPVSAVDYDYNAAASIATLQGNWSLTSLEGVGVSVTIGSTGALSGSAEGCTFTGTLAPRASGKNVYDFELTFGPAPCALPGQRGSGIGIASLISGTTTRQLILAGVTSNRSTGTALFGTR